MTRYELERGEQVILKSGDVQHYRSGASSYNDELVLTNRYLIWVQTGWFGRVKEVNYLPLSSVRFSEGRPEVRSARRGLRNSQLEIVFESNVHVFRFSSGGRKKVRDWVNRISAQVERIHAARRRSGESNRKTTEVVVSPPASAPPGNPPPPSREWPPPTQRPLPPQGQSWPPPGQRPQPRRVSSSCPGCGASLTGISGMIATCQYCDTQSPLS